VNFRQCNGPAVLLLRREVQLAGGAEDQEHAMSLKFNIPIAVVGIDMPQSGPEDRAKRIDGARKAGCRSDPDRALSFTGRAYTITQEEAYPRDRSVGNHLRQSR
jgi:hypothetical protein